MNAGGAKPQTALVAAQGIARQHVMQRDRPGVVACVAAGIDAKGLFLRESGRGENNKQNGILHDALLMVRPRPRLIAPEQRFA